MAYRQKWEEAYIPDMLSPLTSVGTCPVMATPIIKIGNTLYIFSGIILSGAATSTIYSTSWDNPIGWASTGVSFGSGGDIKIGVVNDNVYCWGSTFYSAPVATPLIWTSTGITNSYPRDNCGYAISSKYITMGAGYNGYAVGNVAYASVDTPTSFSAGGSVGGWERSACYLDGDEIIITGGYSETNTLTFVNANKPSLTFNSYSYNYYMSNTSGIFHVGDYLWFVGYNATNYVAFQHVNNLTNPKWMIASSIMPETVTYVRGSQWIGPDGYAYIINKTTGNILRSGRKKIYVIDPPNPNGRYTHRRAVYADTGGPTTYTINCQMGMSPWFTNRRDRF